MSAVLEKAGSLAARSSDDAHHDENSQQQQQRQMHQPVTTTTTIDSSPRRLDENTTTTAETFSHLDEKKILRKMDTRLIPVLTFLYLLAFLDRGNIGNAKIEGLQDGIKGLTDDGYNWCLTVFFFTYAAFEVPSNLLLKKLRPSRWLPSIMVGWGVVMTLMGIVKDYKGLLIARLFLGVAEAGLYPGCAYYLTLWYCRHEIQFRQTIFFSAASIAGAFSGLLAYAIAKMDGVGGLEGWRWIFILEGIATVLVAIASYFLLYDFPETATFLSEEERAFVIFRLKNQGSNTSTTASSKRGDNKIGGGGGGAEGTGTAAAASPSMVVAVPEAEGFEWKYVWSAFTDWQVWASIVVYWGIVCPLYGISFFLPTIIRNLGYESSTAQLLTVPIYIVAAILAVLVALASDRVGKRSPFIIVCLFLMAVGYVMCISTKNPKVVYAGVFVVACALYPAFPGNITWLANNLSGSYKRSTGMALQIGIGNLGGAMASNFYRERDSPRYILGHGLELGFIGAGIVAAVMLLGAYVSINRKRAKALALSEEDGEAAAASRYTVEELADQGDRAITFRYFY